MKWDVKANEYDTRSNVAGGDYYGTGQPPKIGTLGHSYMEGVPMKSKERNASLKDIGVKDITPKKVG